MDIIYVSTYCSETKLKKIFTTAKVKPSLCAQKFNKLFVEGFEQNQCNVYVISGLPVTNTTHDKKIWIGNKERFAHVTYNYISFINLPVIRHLFLFIGSFIKTLIIIFNGKIKNKSIICDVLNISISAGALLAGKLTRVKTVGIVTDLPGQMLFDNKSKKTSLDKIINFINNLLITSYDFYIPITEQMGSVINPKKKPYCIIEGLVDIKMESSIRKTSPDNLKHIIYSGSIYEKFGVKMLIEAFMQIPGEDLRLDIFGQGEMVKSMPYYENLDSRIIYHGVVPNHIVVDNQLRATLLVNPRPTAEDFTKYSFPSKNMEYMASGTAVLTTKLPGMPNDYYPHVFLIDNETVNGIKDSLAYILSLSHDEIMYKGESAKQFVLLSKNNKVQTYKVLELLNQSAL